MTSVAASKWVRVNRRSPCPVCGKPDWCLISRDGKTAICARIGSEKPAGNKGAGWIHVLENSMPLPPPKPRPASIQTAKAAPDVLDTAYRALLAELPLFETHRENLQHRGLTDAQIASLGYRTLSANGCRELVNKLQARGVRLAGVPGFYLEAGERKLAGPAGIAIPVTDTRGRIAGLQVRCDKADTGRYKWLSSRGFNAGCSPAGPVSANGEVWITEGPLKADIAALKLKRVVLAVPGVGNWRGVIPIIRELAPARAVVAFDMDKLTNHAVQLYRDALMTYLINRGIRTFEADWNGEFKGLDDLLTGGQ